MADTSGKDVLGGFELGHYKIQKLRIGNAEIRKKYEELLEIIAGCNFREKELNARWEKLKRRSEKYRDDPLLDITDFISWMQELESGGEVPEDRARLPIPRKPQGSSDKAAKNLEGTPKPDSGKEANP